ncbi:hypothetical protein ONZ45_g6842 [Pleurotus djamor]|nr:hypothetical protein ONZ45_g6842 [Pleurotus djamor]
MEGIEETKDEQPTESTEFPPRLDTDLVLDSADNVHFAVHKVMLTLASPNDLQEIVDSAKVAWLDVRANARPYLNSNPVTNSMPYGWYRELWEFREERSRWLGRQKWSIDDHFQVDQFEWRHALVSAEDMELLWERVKAKPSLRYLRELIAGVDRSKQDEGWAVNIILDGMQRRYEEEFGQ